MAETPFFLLTEPHFFDVNYRINPWMRPDTWRTDPETRRAAAMRASAELQEALLATGAAVETIPAVDGLPDLVFPANAAIVLDGRALLARFLHPERQGEESVFRATFDLLKARGLIEDIIELPPDVLQEGAGDCIWDADRRLFWAGYGQRSTENSIAAIVDVFAQKTIALKLASDRFYHLDTCFCPLAGGKLLYYPPALTSEALANIHANVRPADRIVATDAEASAFCVNAVNIGRHIIMAKAPDTLKKKLHAAGFSLAEIDLSPFILSGGGAYCLTLRIDRTTKRARATSPA